MQCPLQLCLQALTWDMQCKMPCHSLSVCTPTYSTGTLKQPCLYRQCKWNAVHRECKWQINPIV